MRLTVLRSGLIALAALLVLALLLVAALPWVAATQIVRDRIAYELSLWSGYRVSLGAAPELSVWPHFRATLRQVAFHEWDGLSTPPVLTAERVEVSLSALAALRGDAVLSAVAMHSPLLRLGSRGSELDLPASPAGGRMSRAIDAARAVVAVNPASPDRGALPTDTFGTVEFFDGRIAFTGSEEDEILSGLHGRIAWPSLNRPASLTLTGNWHGETVALEASSAQPLMLLAGANAPVKIALKSTLLGASFDGVAGLSGDAFFDGQIDLSSPSLQRTLEWSRTDIASGAAIGAMTIAGRLQGDSRRLRLDQASLTLGGNAGRGVLDVSFPGTVPAISGTLAFDGLDLRSFLAAVAPIAEDGILDPIDTGLADQLSLDLRLSAGTATLGTVALTDVAAAVRVSDGLATFDVSDATAFGGTLQTGIRFDAAEDGHGTVEIRMMADDVDAFAFAKALGADRLVPQGRASVSTILKGSGRDWAAVLANAEGSVSASVGQGALVGFDLGAFRERSAAGGFFALNDVAGGTLPFRGLSLRAKLAGGVARIERADLQLDGQTASLTGIVPYSSRALALSGNIVPVGADGTPGEPETGFFIGGGWQAPYVVRASPAAYE